MPVANKINPGDRFGHLTVIERAGVYEKSGAVLYRCKCDCGREKITEGYNLKRGSVTKCGQWNHEILGKRFGRLTVIDLDHIDRQKAYFRCKCDCGNEIVTISANLTTGHVASCGCLATEVHKKYSEKITRYAVDGTNVKLIGNKPTKANTSGIRGVTFQKSTGKWLAGITFQRKHYHLGSFDRIEDAAEARREAEEILFDPILEKHGMKPTSEVEYQEQLRKAIEKIKEDSKTDENQAI